MPKRRSNLVTGFRAPQNLRREKPTLAGSWRVADKVATNEFKRRKEPVTVWTTMNPTNAELQAMQALPAPGFWNWMRRHTLAVPMLLVCYITWWTLMLQFKGAMNESFWRTAEFWNFAIGILVMAGWFASGLCGLFFLKAYVLGHELTHWGFVRLCGGEVKKLHFDGDGGYVITNKTNLLIALSPYFVPFYSLAVVVIYGVVLAVWALFPDLGPLWPQTPRIFYLVLGATWTFHMVWTIWILPRDQPDLREHGLFYSLVVIFFGNLVVHSALFCLTRSGSVVDNFASFGLDWLGVAGELAALVIRTAVDLLSQPGG